MIKSIVDKILLGVGWFVQTIPYGDKVLHFIIGFIVSTIVLAITGVTWYGFSAAFILGLAKEGYDIRKAGRKVGSWTDWFSSMGGGVVR